MRITGLIAVIGLIALVPAAHAADKCRTGAFALSDAKDIAAVRGAIARACPCADYDASAADKAHGKFVKCAKTVIADALDGTPLLGAFTLRKECRGEVTKLYSKSACGYRPTDERVVCCEAKPSNGKGKATVKPAAKCVDAPNGSVVRHTCWASPFTDVCSGDALNACTTTIARSTEQVPSTATPANTPGTSGVVVTNPKLLTQFGGGSFSLNQARYTRHRLAGPEQQPDAILVLVPGFEGGAGNFKVLAENLIGRAQANGQIVEVWAFDRRTNQLEDSAGLDIAEEFLSPQIALDWLFGGELGLPLSPLLTAGPNRRAVFYDTQGDLPFIANWTNLVFSQDIDAVVEAARLVARNQNVFLGGHSAGTGFTARYAATDFNLTGVGSPQPGYAKVRGLVLLEGGGASTSATPLTADTLDRIEAKFDGGLFGAVRDNAPRCVDGTTACTIATEATDCVGQLPPKCTLPTTSYSVVAGLLNPRILAAGEVSAIQAALDPDGTKNLVIVDQGAAGNNAVAKVPDLSVLSALGQGTAEGGIGAFVDDDGPIAGLAFFVATSVGAPGPVVGGLTTWLDITEGPLPASVLPNNGPAPTTLPAGVWGQEVEPTRFDRLTPTFYAGGTNFTDNYYPNAGPGVTSVTGVCSSGTCTAGNVGAPCSSGNQCSQSVGLDSSALSIGRGRRDIENLTQAANIDIPVIGFGGSNGLAPVPGSFVGFANSIGVCTSPSCNGTPRVVNASVPNPAFPTLGDVAGGFEVHISEGYAHIDVLTAQDDATNHVVGPLAAFLQRNAQ
jgi:pimeloyl-ACP methyl ester carboxylesterase